MDGFYLRPLGELVDGDVEVAVAPRRSRERAKDIQPLDREWPREWDGLEALSRLMDLLGVELTSLAGLHQLSRVVEHCGPVECGTPAQRNQNAPYSSPKIEEKSSGIRHCLA